MSIPKSLVLSFLLLVFFNGRSVDGDCSIKIEYSIETDAQDPGKGQKLIITAKGGNSPYYYILIDSKGYPVSFDYKKNEFVGLKPGKYQCSVVDSRDCRNDVTIVINQ